MAAIAKRNDTVINAVILGVLAGSDELPIPAEKFEDAIRNSGVAVEANLRGFRAGLAHVRGEATEEAADEADHAPRVERGQYRRHDQQDGSAVEPEHDPFQLAAPDRIGASIGPHRHGDEP